MAVSVFAPTAIPAASVFIWATVHPRISTAVPSPCSVHGLGWVMSSFDCQQRLLFLNFIYCSKSTFGHNSTPGFVKIGPQCLLFRCEVPKKLNKTMLNGLLYVRAPSSCSCSSGRDLDSSLDLIEFRPDSRPAAGRHLIGWQLAGPITAARSKTEMTTPFQASYCSDTQSVNHSINQT